MAAASLLKLLLSVCSPSPKGRTSTLDQPHSSPSLLMLLLRAMVVPGVTLGTSKLLFPAGLALQMGMYSPPPLFRLEILYASSFCCMEIFLVRIRMSLYYGNRKPRRKAERKKKKGFSLCFAGEQCGFPVAVNCISGTVFYASFMVGHSTLC